METRARRRHQRPTFPERPPVREVEEPAAVPSAPAWLAVSRGVALFLGVFTLIGVVAELRHSGFEANIWWIDLKPLSVPAMRGVLSFAGVLLIGFAMRPWMPVWRRFTLVAVMVLFVAALWNAIRFYQLWKQAQIDAGFPIPFALHVAALLAVVVAGLMTHAEGSSRTARDLFLGTVAVLICTISFPLLQMYCFGMIDERCDADVAVVFGCRVHADGTPSSALNDRIIAASELFKAGLVKTLVVSGGPGDGAVSETEAMRREAVRLGVPAEAIVLDPQGLNTQLTIDNTVEIIRQLGARRVLAVSHFYHLPRIKLAYHRAGMEVFTVPAKQQRPLIDLAEFQAREVVALWRQYLLPLTESDLPQR